MNQRGTLHKLNDFYLQKSFLDLYQIDYQLPSLHLHQLIKSIKKLYH